LGSETDQHELLKSKKFNECSDNFETSNSLFDFELVEGKYEWR
jgi:hypothetical protein